MNEDLVWPKTLYFYFRVVVMQYRWGMCFLESLYKVVNGFY